jgi:amidohydrolase
VLAALEHLPLELTVGDGLSSVVAVIRGNSRERSVLLRADMDALPVQEQTGLDFASERPGYMHGCGHDLHTSMLVGAAELLCASRDDLDGDVVLMFQPGEEGWEGARVMLGEGVLDASGTRVSAAYALHAFSNEAAGRVWTMAGPILSASSELNVLVTGRGGHASAPHLAQDPLAAAAAMVMELQHAAARELGPEKEGVVSVTRFSAGERVNIIPAHARLWADIRTLSPEVDAHIERMSRRVVDGVAAAHGVVATVDYLRKRPATVNTAAETDLALVVAREVFGNESVSVAGRAMAGSEDFSRVLQEVPGCFVCVGARPASLPPDEAPYNHSPMAVFEDSILEPSARLFATLAHRQLKAASRRSDREL